jgi:DNA-binding transcriptional MocR family regulator
MDAIPAWSAGPAGLKEGSSTLYSGVAEWVVARISQGGYAIGDRLPSIRALSESLKVSVNTVRQAYDLLERRRFVDCRPKSGYFVRREPPQEPEASPVPVRLVPAELPFCRIYAEIRNRSASPQAAAMGLALTSPDLLPGGQLGSIMAGLMRREGERMLDLCVGAGDRELRRQIARLQAEAGISVPADGILVTNGCSEAVYLALSATCRRGDVVAVESPAYFNFFEVLRELGLKALEIPCDPREGLNLDVLRFAIAHHAPKACVASPTYSNPSGACMPEEAKRELVRILVEAGIPLIEDDAHGYLSWSGGRPSACKAYDRSGGVIYCSSFTKTLGAGLRLGWIAPGRYADRVERQKPAMNLAGVGLTQAAAASFLADGSARHMRRLRAAIAARVGAMRDLVAESFPPGTRVSRPAGGILVWAELPEGMDADLLFEAAVREDLLFAPGSIFTASGGFRGFLRLNGSLSGAETERSVRRLGELAAALRDR